MKRAAAVVAALFVGVGILLHRMTLVITYVDSKAYRELGRVPVGESQFWYGIRPPGLPLFLKLSEDNASITHFQTALYLVSSLALAAAAARWMQRAKLAAFSSVLLLALLPHHFLWNRSISSESLTFSLFFLLLALASLLVRRPEKRVWQIVAPLGLLVVTVLFVFTRDANGYFLVFLCVAALIAALWTRERRFEAAAALAITLVLTGICAHQANRGGRWQWPFVNILGQRVLPKPERRAFFEARGMPVNSKVMCLSGKWGYNCDDDLSGFGKWLDGDIKGMYARYLLSHPIETVVAPFGKLGSMLYQRDGGPKGAFYYFHPVPAWYAWPGRVWFQYSLTTALLSALAAWGLRRHWKRKVAFLAPAVLLLAVPPMLFFVHHGDAAEPIRHAVLVASLFRLALWLAILITWDLGWRPDDGKR